VPLKVTEKESFVLRRLLEDQGCIKKQLPVCFLVSVGRLEHKCFHLVTPQIPGLFANTSEHTHFLHFSFSVFPFFICWFYVVD